MLESTLLVNQFTYHVFSNFSFAFFFMDSCLMELVLPVSGNFGKVEVHLPTRQKQTLPKIIFMYFIASSHAIHQFIAQVSIVVCITITVEMQHVQTKSTCCFCFRPSGGVKLNAQISISITDGWIWFRFQYLCWSGIIFSEPDNKVLCCVLIIIRLKILRWVVPQLKLRIGRKSAPKNLQHLE